MKEELKKFIRHDLLNNDLDTDITDDESLVLLGVDSLGVMLLIGYIEGKCGVRIPPEDVTIENFINIDAISRYVEGRLT